MKITQDSVAAVRYGLNLVDVVRQNGKLLVSEAGRIGAGSTSGGGNSGFQALNLAVQFGARKIILVGFDMRIDRGVHWHGRHPGHMNNPRDCNFVKWRAALNDAASVLRGLGVAVINASPVSTLTGFPIMDLEQAMAC